MNYDFSNAVALLDKYRERRGFHVYQYIDAKAERINDFFRTNKLDAAVLGLSGGIDSAITLALLIEARNRENSPIRKICPVIAPIHGPGVTGQMEALSRAVRLTYNYGIHSDTIITDLSRAYEAMCEVNENLTSPWAKGQLASILRTPMFYGQAAALQDKGYRSIVVGTTNRDEGSYIGFFGKASDGMVDLQPIGDIHKSEVHLVALALNVTQEIMDVTPKGDVWDGRVDEEMIGSPYWFLELYLLGLENGEHVLDLISYKDNLSAYTQMVKWVENIENLHRINAHKYAVGSPAHFIDVIPRKIPGGW